MTLPPLIDEALKELPFGGPLRPLLARAKLVSFDFFDTLFARPFAAPEAVFEMLGYKLGMADFRQRRIRAQQEAFKVMHRKGRNEISLDDIYACFDAQGRSPRDLASAELDLELALVKPRPEALRLYAALQRDGSRALAITSDMYLPRIFFERALSEHGLEARHLLVSCDLNATKRDTGALFKELLRISEHLPGDILHLGDNPVSDVARATQHGLMTFHWPKGHGYPVNHADDAMRAPVAHGLLEREGAEACANVFERVGFLYGGPANLGFLQWVAARARADGIEHLLFLARDGFLMHRLAEVGAVSDLPTHSYFLGSRTALSLAAIDEMSFDTSMPFLLSGSADLHVGELLDRIGVERPAAAVLSDLGLGEEVRNTPERHAAFGAFLSSWRQPILQVCRKNRRGLRMYLSQLGVRRGQRVGLVDVGWSGSTQEAFCAAIDKVLPLDVVGYYFLLADTEDRRRRASHLRMQAMFDSTSLGADITELVYQRRAVIELFFSAPHETVIGWEPHFGRGSVGPLTDPGRGANSARTFANVESIIAGAQRFYDAYRRMCGETGADLPPQILASAMLDLVLHEPTLCKDIAEQTVNFDAWSSTVHRTFDLLSYRSDAPCASSPSRPW